MNQPFNSNSTKAKRRNDAGMTLIELMIAAGIMTVAFVLLFGSIISISTTGQMTEDRALAAAHMGTITEELQGLGWDEFLAYEPPALGGLGTGAQINIELIDTSGANETVLGALPTTHSDLATAFPPNPIEARITVSWLDTKGHQVSTSATALFAR
ncbi:MAG: prepilin-type N-terminal cleavage/methylation domain-containing protein [Candidatus Hydrogenedentota bacterium]